MPTVTTQQFVTAAAGCAGLLALLQDSGIVNIFDPADLSSLSDHVDLLSQQAISLWRQFLLTFYEDKRIPNAHFALGLLESQKGRLAESIAEYKLVANRFSRSALAPYALLHSSKLKANLNDYYGASEDLKQLVEQYPDTEIASQSYLHLADATMKAQLYDEAGRLYRKIYNLDLSLEAQTTSALGAAKCFYEKKDYENAAKWLARYISLTTDSSSSNLYSAYSLLGKSYLALKKTKQACDAFQYALSGGLKWLSREEYVQTLSVLVKTHMEQEQLIEALDALKNAPSTAFSQQDSIEILLLRSKIFRALGLLDKAIATIGDQAEYISDPALKAKLSFESANCQIAKGNLELARKSLTEILIFVEPGLLAHEIALKLADVCSKLDQNSQTISICSQLLDLDTSPQIKQKTLELLAAAYKRQKNYDKAALALLGRWNDIENQ
jgi:tetratricopeptide (TPR) repeat protein